MNLACNLRKITQNPMTHAKWLNGLSYLEYRGLRKIIRSHSTEDMDSDVLFHAAEEIRHAVFFKRQAMKIGGKKFSQFNEETLICAPGLKKYFYEIDLGVKNLISADVYAVVTWLVEKRAMALYTTYEQTLREKSFSFSLSGILREEAIHLDELGSRAESLVRNMGFEPLHFLKIEEREFNSFWSNIEALLAP